MERRLAAILAADVVGYSRLMGADEGGTLERLKALRKELVQPKIAERGGRIVKLMGDGLLAEFASVVEAVACAVDIQQAMNDREPDLPEDRRIALRIGINLGDVIVEGSDLYGDGVNVTARLETLAEPGGICVSGTVFDHVHGKVDLGFADLGKQRVKNIDNPVRVFEISPAGQPATRSVARNCSETPSIAVLPFNNISDDADQAYFSDGITEDIITELSRFGGLTVIARNASFSFKGATIDVTQVGRTLGVHYVVEGSVRRVGNRVRITAQLIEAETGNHVWAERYDRELEDIFAVQDEVTRSIVGVLPGRIEVAVAERAARKRTDNMRAYEYLLQGKAVRDGFSADDTARAREFFEKAIELDPRYAKAHAYLADTYFMDLFMGVAAPDAAQRSLDHARRAMSLDSSDVANHDQLGFAYIGAGLWEDAEAQFDRALAKVVIEAEPMTWIGYGLLLLGRAEEACTVVREAIRLNPLHPPSFDWVLGQTCYFAKRYEEAVRALPGRALLNSFAYACLAGAYAQLRRSEEAQAALEAFVRERQGEFDSRGMAVEADTIEALAGGYRRMWRREADWNHLAEGLRKAGLPD